MYKEKKSVAAEQKNLINKGKYNRMGPSTEEPHWGLHLHRFILSNVHKCTSLNDMWKRITMGNSWTAIMVITQ